MSGFSPYFKFKWDVSQYHSFLAPNCIFPSLDIQKIANKCYENCLPKAKNVLHLLCSELAEEKEYIYFIMINAWNSTPWVGLWLGKLKTCKDGRMPVL